MSSVAIEEILRLPPAERLEAVELIWESLVDSIDDEGLLEPSDSERAELRQRLEEHERDPSSSIPWAEVRRKLGAK